MKAFLPALGLLFVSSAALAQTTPPPSQPFPAPITGYAGRYLDAAETIEFQFPNRTLRTNLAKAAPELNLMLVDQCSSRSRPHSRSSPRSVSVSRVIPSNPSPRRRQNF